MLHAHGICACHPSQLIPYKDLNNPVFFIAHMDFRPPPTLTTETTEYRHSKRAQRKDRRYVVSMLCWDARTTRVNVITLANTKNFCLGKSSWPSYKPLEIHKMMKVTGSKYRQKNYTRAMDQNDWSPTWRIIPGLGSAVSSFSSPNWGCGNPFEWPLLWLIHGGYARDNQCSMANQSTPPPKVPPSEIRV